VKEATKAERIDRLPEKLQTRLRAVLDACERYAAYNIDGLQEDVDMAFDENEGDALIASVEQMLSTWEEELGLADDVDEEELGQDVANVEDPNGHLNAPKAGTCRR